MHTTESKVGTNLSNLIEISLERGSDISFHKPQKQAESEMIGLIFMIETCYSGTYCKWTKGLIGKLIWNLNLPFSNSNMTSFN